MCVVCVVASDNSLKGMCRRVVVEPARGIDRSAERYRRERYFERDRGRSRYEWVSLCCIVGCRWSGPAECRAARTAGAATTAGARRAARLPLRGPRDARRRAATSLYTLTITPTYKYTHTFVLYNLSSAIYCIKGTLAHHFCIIWLVQLYCTWTPAHHFRITVTVHLHCMWTSAHHFCIALMVHLRFT